MANGLLEEIRRIAESSKDVPQEVVNRLILTSLAELVVKVDKHTEIEETKNRTMDDAIEQVNTSIGALNHQVAEISSKLTALTVELEKVRSNPLVSIGKFIGDHPKTSLFTSLILIAAFIVLISSQPFVIMVLTLIGVPREAIEQILLLLHT